jgi:hypothetical protein
MFEKVEAKRIEAEPTHHVRSDTGSSGRTQHAKPSRAIVFASSSLAEFEGLYNVH